MSTAEIVDLDATLEPLLKLSPKHRLDLAERLIESVGGFASPEIERAWLDEADRRHGEMKSGLDQGVPAAQALVEARQVLDERRQAASSRAAGDD